MLLALALTALADEEGVPAEVAADVACSPLMLTRSIPAANQVDVPVDVTATLMFEGNCGGAHLWTFDILDAEGTVLFTQEWTWDDSVTALATVNPDEDLPANADLILRATPSAVDGEWGELVEVPFSTGESHIEPLVGLPVVLITSADWFKNTQSVSVLANIVAADDPHDLSMLHIQFPGGGFFTPDSSMVDQSFGWSEAEAPDEVCISVSQIDGSGVESALVTDCAVPEIHQRAGGCFAPPTTRTVSSSFLFLGALGLLRRRKV